jgi:glutathione peroxidase
MEHLNSSTKDHERPLGRTRTAITPLILVFVFVSVTSAFAQRQSSPNGPVVPQEKTWHTGQNVAGPKAGGQKESPVGSTAGPVSGAGQDGDHGAGERGGRRRGGGGGDAAKAEKNAYDYYLPGPDGKDIPLAAYKGKYIVVVNLGRKSSYNDQLPALIKLNDTYKGKGLVVIGVPSNDFGGAEPGTNAEIQKAYIDAKVDFPIVGLSKLTGDDELPFFQYLTTGKSAPPGGGVAWNFTKFVIDKKGNVVARMDPDVAPDSVDMLATIDQILDGTYKPKRAVAVGSRAGGVDGGGAGPPD